MYRRIVVLLAVIVAFGAPGLAAQESRWAVAVEVGRASVHGTSRDSTDDLAFRPHATALLSGAVQHRRGRIALAAVLSYGQADLGLGGPDLLLVDRTTTFAFYELAALVGVRVMALGDAAALLVRGGPVVGRWTLTDQPGRTRFGGRVDLALPVAFGQSLGGVATLAAVVTPSVFEEGELPAGYTRSATWRLQLALGLFGSW